MQSKKGSQVLYIIILGALTAIGAMSIDMFLPGLPEVQRDFNTSASSAQLTLGLFMVGLALGNLFVGPLSDTYGRRRPLTIAMLVFTVASLGIVFAPNIWVMIGLRFIQGLCGGAGAVLSRSIASDLYQGQALTQFMSMLMLVNGVAPVIAPALGGVIITVAHWQVVFMVLVVFGVCLTLGSYMQVGETDVKDVEEGKDVDISIDGEKAKVKGKVDQVGKATASSFSMMPSSNSDGNYTKVTQVVPVKIKLDSKPSNNIVPGMNAEVKIHKN